MALSILLAEVLEQRLEQSGVYRWQDQQRGGQNENARRVPGVLKIALAEASARVNGKSEVVGRFNSEGAWTIHATHCKQGCNRTEDLIALIGQVAAIG
jgi:hypothetical protein